MTLTSGIKALLRGAVVAAALAATSAFGQANPGGPSLLSAEAGPSSPARPGRGVVRSQRVAPDKAVLAQLRAQLQNTPGEPRTLVLRFFEDATFVVRIDRIGSPGLGATSYHGHVIGRNDGHVVIVEKNGNLNINVEAAGRTYQLRYFGAQGYFAREVNVTNIPNHPPTGVPEANFKPVPKTEKIATGESIPVALTDDGSQIDVMVVYTQAARLAAGGAAAMDLLVTTGVSQVNSIYSNSGVVHQLRLVHLREVAHTEIDMETDLVALADPADGVLDDVHILRDAYGADFVSLWGAYGDYCGLAFLMGAESNTFEATAFNLVAQDCASGGTTFAHELGHNMGLRHDFYQQTEVEGSSPGTTVTPAGLTTPTPIYYSNGYVDTVNRFRTVMSYNTQCSDLGYPSDHCFLVPHFSNPAISISSPYNSVVAPTGSISDCSYAPPGDPSLTCAHEQRVLNDTRETTANFRTAVTLNGPGRLVFMPKTHTVAEAGGTVTLTVARLAGSTGAVGVTYSTSNGTATAGSDYVAKTSTLSWPNGNTDPQTITISILSDAVAESNEKFNVVLSSPTGGATVGSIGCTATVTIIDDEGDGFAISCSALSGGFTTSPSPDNWTPATDHYYGTPCSLRSANILSDVLNEFVHSDLTYEGDFLAGNVTFNYRVSSEIPRPEEFTEGSFFKFFVDGVEKKSDTGESGWVAHSEPISAGHHVLTWRFTNSLNFECRFKVDPPAPGGANCADRAWIDNLIMPTGAAVTLASVSSRKTHPASGTWDRPIDFSQPITGNISTESRPAASGNHTIAFTFTTGIATPGTVTCQDVNNNPIGSCSVVAQGTAAIVTLGGIGDNTRVRVSLAGVHGNGANNFSASVGFLAGDGNNNRSVTASDILAAKGRVGQAIGPTSFSYDTNLSGTLTSGDVDIVKQSAGVSLN